MPQLTIKQLLKNLPQQGQVEWLGVRAEKRKDLTIIETVNVLKKGLEGRSEERRVGKECRL